jgi:hypothetical protein
MSLLERLKKEFGSEVGGSSGYSYDYDPATQTYTQTSGPGMKKGGSVKSSASKRADGIAIRGKTRA